jgi:hypothetical protein
MSWKRHFLPEYPVEKEKRAIIEVSIPSFEVPQRKRLFGFVTMPRGMRRVLAEVNKALPLGRRAGQRVSVGFLRQREGMLRSGVKSRREVGRTRKKMRGRRMVKQAALMKVWLVKTD